MTSNVMNLSTAWCICPTLSCSVYWCSVKH